MGNAVYIGVDVGTGSVRSCILERDGTLLASATQAIRTWRDSKDHRIFEQSTADIWDAICSTVKQALKESGVASSAVRGIGFDATCSLAVVDANGSPVAISKGEQLGSEGERNVILWADHRAEAEAEVINATESIVLEYVGGTVSLEMEIPKILWLKRNMQSKDFERCQFFDLPDYLTYRATGSTSRSCCSLTCKCNFLPNEGWKPEFFTQIGLDSVVAANFAQIGQNAQPVLTAGLPVGAGLSASAARELGLDQGTPVASSVIDAYAGWIGTVATRYREQGASTAADAALSPAPTLASSALRLAAVAGTSTCYLIQSPRDIFVTGVWGPYKNAVFPGYWMNEGGQSSTGQLIDFVLTTHSAYPELQQRAKDEQRDQFDILFDTLEALCAEEGLGKGEFTELTRHMHMYPDLHGNRSPLADPRMRGAIMGLSLDAGLGDLARKFYLALEAIALQTRHIVDAMREKGHTIDSIFLSGGQARNARLCALIAALCDCEVVIPASSSTAVVRGAAVLARAAADFAATSHRSSTATWNTQDEVKKAGEDFAEELWNIMVEMTPPGTVIRSTATDREKKILDVKYRIFKETIEIQRRWRKDIDEAANL
ncbi:Pentulose kinase [Exidia glandulosa HHB12029]|uniref:Pentulose kinase n=1 Tax=Exidia glandulosa HHB12029 TaxID=1314781 RepID=A0A165E9X8_EXIGL|nr:Pentulose kinase [Exidia glandulosa HHB12029]